TKKATATVTLMPPAGTVSVSVSPGTATLGAGKTQQFTATVTGNSNTSVTWSLSPSTGTISTGGLYQAPASVASQQTVTVTATSVADATKSASATVTLTPFTPIRVNAGGPAYTDTLGQVWAADTGFSGGSTASTT